MEAGSQVPDLTSPTEIVRRATGTTPTAGPVERAYRVYMAPRIGGARRASTADHGARRRCESAEHLIWTPETLATDDSEQLATGGDGPAGRSSVLESTEAGQAWPPHLRRSTSPAGRDEVMSSEVVCGSFSDRAAEPTNLRFQLRTCGRTIAAREGALVITIEDALVIARIDSGVAPLS